MNDSLIIGVDLDLTIIDTRMATAEALRLVNSRFDLEIDIEKVVSRIGPPIRGELTEWVATEDLDVVVQYFRAALLSDGLALLEPSPGATELVEFLSSRGHAVNVITSRRREIAMACLDICGIRVSDIYDSVTGAEKAGPLRKVGAYAYIGDHPLDMEAAQLANVHAIGVVTGNHGEAALCESGAHEVFRSLLDVIEWFENAQNGFVRADT